MCHHTGDIVLKLLYLNMFAQYKKKEEDKNLLVFLSLIWLCGKRSLHPLPSSFHLIEWQRKSLILLFKI